MDSGACHLRAAHRALRGMSAGKQRQTASAPPPDGTCGIIGAGRIQTASRQAQSGPWRTRMPMHCSDISRAVNDWIDAVDKM
jgi:hypothetical protein